MTSPFIVQSTHKIHVTKFATLIVGVFLMLGSFYDQVYLFFIGISSKKIDLTLLDYIRTGLDLLPVTLLFIFYALFSLKGQPDAKSQKNSEKNNDKKHISLKRKLYKFYAPVFVIFILYTCYTFEILKSGTLLLFLFMSPVIIYSIQERKISQIIKRKITYAHSLTIKIVLILAGVFTILSVVDAYADMYRDDFVFHTISLRTPTSFTIHKSKFNEEVHMFKGYTMRVFDHFSIFNVNGEPVIINNWEVLSVEK